jgi:NADH dehydrogenase (ubiquinone) 1 alpha subcomplex subunit 6
MPVAKVRAKIREEFEKHRYVNHLQAVDVLLAQSHMEFQVGLQLTCP